MESTLWTIVEENVGIICACLPMFRPFLSIIIPKLFPKRDYSRSGGSAKFSNGSSGRDGWTPPVPTRTKNIQLSSVVKGNNNSQEMFIAGMHESPAMSDGTITKITHFSIKYGSWNSDVSAPWSESIGYLEVAFKEAVGVGCSSRAVGAIGVLLVF